MIEEVEAIGFEARFEPSADKADIRQIVSRQVSAYRRKFLLAMIFQVPILLLVWLIPHTNPEFITAYNGWNGIPLYAFLTGGLATVIQLFLGASFYVRSFKALRNKAPNMDVLVMLGTTAAWSYSVALIVVGYDEEYRANAHLYHM